MILICMPNILTKRAFCDVVAHKWHSFCESRHNSYHCVTLIVCVEASNWHTTVASMEFFLSSLFQLFNLFIFHIQLAIWYQHALTPCFSFICIVHLLKVNLVYQNWRRFIQLTVNQQLWFLLRTFDVQARDIFA